MGIKEREKAPQIGGVGERAVVVAVVATGSSCKLGHAGRLTACIGVVAFPALLLCLKKNVRNK